jgi:hypothetical protein
MIIYGSVEFTHTQRLSILLSHFDVVMTALKKAKTEKENGMCGGVGCAHTPTYTCSLFGRGFFQ